MIYLTSQLSELDKYKEFLKIRPIIWDPERKELSWIDTRLIPFKEVYISTKDYRKVAHAIRTMEIRGAPAIGVAAAFGMTLAAYESAAKSVADFIKDLETAKRVIASTRPTAFNLFWALNRIMKRVKSVSEREDINLIKEAIENEAISIMLEDIKSNIEMGRLGSKLIDNNDKVLTHCNTGALATAGFGTALGVIRYAFYEGKNIEVIATETRPLLQGARLTVWELKKEGIPFTLVTDSMAGIVFRSGKANKAIVGADRIVLTGHTANKIGTYMIALAANHNQKPFYVSAPTSTIQPSNDPKSIIIEERDPNEIRKVLGKLLITVPDAKVYNPAFDITPPELITSIITEKGIINPPYLENLQRVLNP